MKTPDEVAVYVNRTSATSALGTILTQNLTHPTPGSRIAGSRKPAFHADFRPMTRLGIEPRTY